MGRTLSQFVDDLAWAVLVGAAVLVTLALCSPVKAAGCGQFFAYRQTYTYAAPVIAVPQVYYQAGRDIEADALAAKVAKLVIGQLRQELTAPRQQQASASVLSQACAKCHSGATPKGGVTIDGQTPMECSQILAAIRAVADGSMPKGATLSAEQKGKILDELLSMEADKSSPPQIPQPQETGVLK